ncbi:hypothetical protein AGMMS50276_09270 [Synergistales bacterium]|nr:hypothetical protein AGMMS50276_09270 [Synergistales bacterium]
MPEIRATIEQILSKSASIKSGVERMFASQKTIDKTASAMGPDFSGKLPNILLQNILNMKTKFDAMHENLTQYSTFLSHAANAYENTDKVLARAMGDGARTVITPGGNNGVGEVILGGNAPNGSPNLAAPNMNSRYYSLPASALNAITPTGTNKWSSREHMDCVYYAHARAMEVNQLETYTTQGTGGDIQANSVARFPGHSVFIENVEYENGQPSRVTFTESNWADQEDGHQTTMSFEEFSNRGGANNNITYTYF